MIILKLGSTGPAVDLIQSILKELTLYKGEIDGIFGKETEAAVKQFQRDAGITPDGIVGPDTYDKMFGFINGYTIYKIQPNDTFYKLAQQYRTNVNSIIVANPNMDPNNLQIGSVIVIPFSRVVRTDVRYSSTIMQSDVMALSVIYPFLQVGKVGSSFLNNDIPYIRIGTGPKEVMYNASIHANEWITSVLLMKFLEEYCQSLVLGKPFYGYNPLDIYNNTSLYIVPMVNPDGVDIVTGNIQPGNEIYESVKNVASRFPNIPFPSGWKANIRGVDLDLQFPANWDIAKSVNTGNGFNGPAPSNFVGYGPLTEPESLALYNFTLSHNFRLTLSYHTQGNMIYYTYNDLVPAGSQEIAKRFSQLSGYSLGKPSIEYANATYRDWFIQDYNRPGFTIKVGTGNNPIPLSQFDQIYKNNTGILTYAAMV